MALEDVAIPKDDDTIFQLTFTFPVAGPWWAMILFQPKDYGMQWYEYQTIRCVTSHFDWLLQLACALFTLTAFCKNNQVLAFVETTNLP